MLLERTSRKETECGGEQKDGVRGHVIILLTTPTDVTYEQRINLFAMALGPGKHLKGLKCMGGLVTPKEVHLVAFCRVMSGDLTRTRT